MIIERPWQPLRHSFQRTRDEIEGARERMERSAPIYDKKRWVVPRRVREARVLEDCLRTVRAAERDNDNLLKKRMNGTGIVTVPLRVTPLSHDVSAEMIFEDCFVDGAGASGIHPAPAHMLSYALTALGGQRDTIVVSTATFVEHAQQCFGIAAFWRQGVATFVLFSETRELGALVHQPRIFLVGFAPP